MLSSKVYVSQFGMNVKLKSLRLALIALLAGGPLWSDAQAATAANAFVTVSSSTDGVESIVPVGADFYITTRNVSKPSFRADITVVANSPYYLVKPAGGKMNLSIGEKDEYKVKDESGNEDEFSGKVHVLKLDIEPSETNVCWKSTGCTLKLTNDSFPGGTAKWTSSPVGISGSGNSITFNQSSLNPGEYVVTAKSEIVQRYFDTCVVRVVRPKITAPSEHEVHLLGEEMKFVGGIEPAGLSDVNYSWRVTKGTCNPSSATAKDFLTTLKSDGDIEVELSVAIGAITCRTNRIVKSARPEVTKLSWRNDHAMTRWSDRCAIVDPVWVKELGGLVLTNYPGAYTKNSSASAELFITASNQLTHATSVQVRGLGNKENFYAKGAVFHRWLWTAGELVLSSSPLYNSVNYYDTLDIQWQYRVRKQSGGWSDWVNMNNSSHMLYIVDSAPAASPLYDLGVDKACRYANGSANYAAAINTGFAGDIYYRPTGCTSHDLGIFSVGYGQCCCHAYVLSLLLAHVTSEDSSVEYCWGGCANDVVCVYNYRGWQGPSFRCQRPAVDSAEANPHFAFHVEVSFKGTIYDPAYGLTGWAPMLEFAPAITNEHPNKSEFQSGHNFPAKIHRVNWSCGH